MAEQQGAKVFVFPNSFLKRKGTLSSGSSEPWTPMTGNPENGDYLDWFRRLEESMPKSEDVIPLLPRQE